MNYSDLIVDFAKRTLRNLDHIQRQAYSGNEEVYPVTQLWNSLLGLIVLPRERDLRRIPRVPLTELWSEGWPRVTESGPERKLLSEFVGDLRNAVTHFNVEFRADADGDITSVTVWTQDSDSDGRPVRGSRRWVGRLTVEDLDLLSRLIAETYLREFASTSK